MATRPRPTPPVLDVTVGSDRARAVDAVCRGYAMGYWFGNLYAIGARPDGASFRRVNEITGRPADRPGSVVTTPHRLARLFDWTRVPFGVDRPALRAAVAELVALGPVGIRGPATDSIPEHLAAFDGPVRTVQALLPGVACPSNLLVDELLDRIGGDLILGTSASRSKVATCAGRASHVDMAAFRAEFDDVPGMVFLGPPDEAQARAGLPLHRPGSVSIVSFHGSAYVAGVPAIVLERHGSLAPEVIRSVLGRHGFTLRLAEAALRRMPVVRPTGR